MARYVTPKKVYSGKNFLVVIAVFSILQYIYKEVIFCNMKFFTLVPEEKIFMIIFIEIIIL